MNYISEELKKILLETISQFPDYIFDEIPYDLRGYTEDGEVEEVLLKVLIPHIGKFAQAGFDFEELNEIKELDLLACNILLNRDNSVSHYVQNRQQVVLINCRSIIIECDNITLIQCNNIEVICNDNAKVSMLNSRNVKVNNINIIEY